MVSRRLTTVLLMGLIALSSLQHIYGVPIVEDDRDEANPDHIRKDEVASEASFDPSSLMSAIQMAEVDYSPIAYDPDASNTLLNSVYEPIRFYPGLDSMIAEEMYRHPRDASQSKNGLQNMFVNPYVYGLAKLPDTEVLNSKECVEHHLTHLEPSMTSNRPQAGCFLKKRKFTNILDKVCTNKSVLNQKFIFFYFYRARTLFTMHQFYSLRISKV